MSPETIQVGVLTTVVGLLVVFGVLILISLITWLLGREKKQKNTAVAAAENIEPTANVTANVNDTAIDPKTVAIIMAAISAATGRSIHELKFTQIKRNTGYVNAWNASGTNEIINTRQSYL